MQTWPALVVLISAIAAPLACGLATMVLPRRWIGVRTAVALCGPIIAMSLLVLLYRSQGLVGVESAQWMPGLRLSLRFNMDRLGLFFAMLVAGVGLPITLYARAYFGPDPEALYRFFPRLHLFMTAMLGVALADNFMLLLLFWELTTISSFLLIGWDREDPSAVRSAMQAFIVTGAGGLCMMAGFILIGFSTSAYIPGGAWAFSDLVSWRQTGGSLVVDGVLITAVVLLVIGACAKSAQFPLHAWLPAAMVAPTPVSGFLHAAAMVKAGVYLLGRLYPVFADLPGLEFAGVWPALITPVAAVTMVYGSYLALRQKDLKLIFAYTTVSQLGLLVAMYALAGVTHDGHANVIWESTQILSHALYKAPLFIIAGALGIVASRELPRLHGLVNRGRTAAIMTWVLLLAAYAMAALPGSLSFAAKEFFLYQVWHAYESTHSAWYLLLMAAAVVVGAVNMAIFVRIAAVTLGFSKPDPAPHDDGHGAHGHAGDSAFWRAFLWVPAVLLLAFQYLGGLAPQSFEVLIRTVEPSPRYFVHLPSSAQLLAHPGPPLYLSLASIVVGIAIGVSPLWRRTHADPFDNLYPGFYKLSTKGGGWLFGRVQVGDVGGYVALVMLALVAVFLWSIGFDLRTLGGRVDFSELLDGKAWPAFCVTGVLCLAAVLMAIVRDRAARVLVLATVGFSVTSLFYLYGAPDLALTQIAIEIVSLIVFLLVLSLLPEQAPRHKRARLARLMIAGSVGLIMFWLTLESATPKRMAPPYALSPTQEVARLGDYFLRNSLVGQDTLAVPASSLQRGVVPRAVARDGASELAPAQPQTAPAAALPSDVLVHPGGGGRNVVNVILVDFRGFDTLGEITVLGLAALGVWTLLRMHPRARPRGGRPDSQPVPVSPARGRGPAPRGRGGA